jgi:hypothetical protein
MRKAICRRTDRSDLDKQALNATFKDRLNSAGMKKDVVFVTEQFKLSAGPAGTSMVATDFRLPA